MEYSGYQVELSDLYAAGNDFRKYALEVRGLMGDRGLPCPLGGNNDIDQAMAVTLRAIADVHPVLAQAIDSHGRKLLTAADTYSAADANASNAADLIAKPSLTNVMNTTLTTGSIKPDIPYSPDVPPSTVQVPAARPATSDLGHSTTARAVAAAPTADQSWPVSCAWGMLGGQPHDMSSLAHELFGVGAAGHDIVIDLTGRVENLVGDTVRFDRQSWSGEVSGEFSRAYNQDALNFYEFIRSCVAAGNIINGLACFLAAKEAWLDGYVEGQIKASGGDMGIYAVPWSQAMGTGAENAAKLNLGPAEYLLGNTVVYSGSGSDQSGSPLWNVLEQAAALMDQVNNERASAANELLEIGQALLLMLDWYSKNGGSYGTLDPGGLLSDPQETSVAGAATDIRSELGKALRTAHPSASDLRNAYGALSSTSGDLNRVGGFAGALGDINANIKQLKDGGLLATATKTGAIAGDLGTIGDVAATVLPIIVMAG